MHILYFSYQDSVYMHISLETKVGIDMHCDPDGACSLCGRAATSNPYVQQLSLAMVPRKDLL